MINKKVIKNLNDIYDKIEQLDVEFENVDNADKFDECRDSILISIEEMVSAINTDGNESGMDDES